MRVIIIRPFGTREGVDFDAVEDDLISPALDELGVGDRATIEILDRGNIPTDEFQLLLTADLVIANLSVRDANVFYDLGIRHAFRDRHTLLVKRSGEHAPFDLSADGYFDYDGESPGSDIDGLVGALRRAIGPEAADSPIFEPLPGLKAQDRAGLAKVPSDFREEVELARHRQASGDLALLAEEIQRFALEWSAEGLRLVGHAQVRIKDSRGARETWAAILRRFQGDDPQVNQRLATIFQKEGYLARWDEAVARAVSGRDPADFGRADLLALRGSNEKIRRREGWEEQPEGEVDAEDRSPPRAIVFTGHRIDSAGRTMPRFPAAAEVEARRMIYAAVVAEIEAAEGRVFGYAGGASGGDILFHEICEELGVATRLFLAGPRDEYVRASVRASGADWVRRFDRLHARVEADTRVLSDGLELPRWLRGVPDYTLWQRSNLWLLENGLAQGSTLTTLIALWNHETGDGPGGTEDMVRIAEDRGARTVILDARELVRP